jgi:hypothetical protein
MQWKQKHQALMLERERADAAKAADLKAKVESSRLEAKELKQTFKEHFDSAAVMMRVVASTFAKLAAVENAREKNLQQSEMEVSAVCYRRCVALLTRAQAAAQARRSSSLNSKSRASRWRQSSRKQLATENWFTFLQIA